MVWLKFTVNREGVLETTANPVPSEGSVTITHVIYALHAFSVAAGVVGAATVVGMFVTGWPSLIAVILNYIKRGDVRGTWLESHFRWQIRTFWFTLLWGAIAVIFILTIIGMLVGVPLLFIVGIWVIYRVIRGWLKLLAREPMPVPVVAG